MDPPPPVGADNPHMPAQHVDPFAGPLALLGALVATSVFTIGLLSHRSHAALTEARELLQQDVQDPSQRAKNARDVVADALSYVMLAANLLLVCLTILAAWSAQPQHMGFDGKVTLGGFCFIEFVIVVLGFHDHARVRHRLNQELEAVDGEIQLEPPRQALWSECKAGLLRAGSTSQQ